MATARACCECCACDVRGERCCPRLPTWRNWRTLVNCLAGGGCCTCLPSPSSPPAHAVSSESTLGKPETEAPEITQPGFVPAIPIPPSEIGVAPEQSPATSASQITRLVTTELNGVTPAATLASVITLGQPETPAVARSTSEITLEQAGNIISILEAELDRLDPNAASSSSVLQRLSHELSRWEEHKQTFTSFIESMPNKVVKEGETLVTSLLTEVLGGVGSVHWLGVGLLFIGWSLENVNKMGQNRNDCIENFRRSLHVLRSTKQIWETAKAAHIEGPSKEGVLLSSIEVALKCAVFCSSNCTDNRVLRFFKAANVKEALDTFGKELDRAIQQNTEMMVRHNFHPGSIYERQVTLTHGDIVGGQVVIEKAVNYLKTKSDEIMAICLYGMGGIGKSALGKEIFTKFQKSKYIDCEVELQLETNDRELCDVQKQILEKVCKKPSEKFSNISVGIEIMQKELKKITKPIFLYVDNISEADHLVKLLPKASFFPEASRILMTSRGENVKNGITGLKIRRENCKLVEVKKLQKDDARRLLWKHIEGEGEHIEGEGEDMSIGEVESLEETVLNLCDGLPLALTLVGRYIASEGSTKVEVWQQVVDDMQKGEPFDGLEKDPLYSHIMFTLRKLDPNVQRDFLDIVFFVEWLTGPGVHWQDRRLPWETVGRLVGTKSLKVLSQRGLVRKPEGGDPEIHDVIRAGGRRMIREHEKEFRISGTEQFEEGKKTQKALKKVVALAHTTVDACLLEKMQELRLLCSVRVEGACQNVQLRKLRVVIDLSCPTPTVFDWSECADLKELRWGNEYKADAAPPVSNLEMFKHQKFSMGFEALTLEGWWRLKDVDAIESLTCLKVLRLQYCKEIESLPEGISRLTCLEVLVLSLCESLRSLPEGIQKLQGLKGLDLSGCRSLQSLPEGIQELQGLENLKLLKCESLRSLPEGIQKLQGLKGLRLSGCRSLQSLPEGIQELQGLENLDLSECEGLRSLPEGIQKLQGLKGLCLSGWRSLQSLPEGIQELQGLENLDLSQCEGLRSLPEGIQKLQGLKGLRLSGWRSLQSLPEGIQELQGLENLDLSLCESLRSLPEGIQKLQGLKGLDLWGCRSLQSLPEGIQELQGLENLELSECKSLRSLPEGIQKLQGLKGLCLWGCRSLQSLPEGIQELQGLENLDLSKCESLRSLPGGVTSLTGLVELCLHGCKRLKNLPEGIENLRGITYSDTLDLSDLRRIKYLPLDIAGFTSLKGLNLSGCGGLQCLPDGVSGLTGLTSLQLKDCRRLQALPEGIACLRGLKELDLGGCRTMALQPLRKVLSYLTGLTWLGLAGWGSLEALPEMLGLMTGLRELDLSGCKTLQFLPDEISQLTGLESLRLSGCESLQSIEGVTTLTALKTLDVRDCTHLQFLPEGCTRWTSLSGFYLVGCSSIKCIPESIGSLTHLESLDLENCTSLESLPEGVTRLSNLGYLSLLGCRSLQSLPGGLIGSLTRLGVLKLGECAMPVQPLLEEVSCKMTGLEVLELTKCEDLHILPQGISNLVSLEWLSLSGCQNLQILPAEGMENWRGLKGLDLSGCQGLQSLPQQLVTLTALSSLDLSGCRHLQSLPQGTFASLIALERLIMNECVSLQLEESQGIAMLALLESLELSKCEQLLSPLLEQGVTTSLKLLKRLNLSSCSSLQALPEGVAALTSLESLDLSKCVSLQSLCNLPQESLLSELHLAGCGSLDQPIVWETFRSLKSLKVLCLSGWETMQALSEGIGSLESLRRLDLSSCSNLLTLPSCITKLEELTNLSLADCKSLQSLPQGITRLEDLEHLDLSGCTSLEPLCEDIKFWISSINNYRPACLE